MKVIVRNALIASLYVVLTVINPFSFESIQFRISEILILLVFFRKDYFLGLVVGCIIANLFSPMGIYDVLFGTIATILSLICIMYSKHLFITWIFSTIFNAIIVGLELYLILELPFWASLIGVAIGEAVVMIIGVVLFYFLKKNKAFMILIEANQNCNLESDLSN
jgi:uncharacterized membrane protein